MFCLNNKKVTVTSGVNVYAALQILRYGNQSERKNIAPIVMLEVGDSNWQMEGYDCYQTVIQYAGVHEEIAYTAITFFFFLI